MFCALELTRSMNMNEFCYCFVFNFFQIFLNLFFLTVGSWPDGPSKRWKAALCKKRKHTVTLRDKNTTLQQREDDLGSQPKPNIYNQGQKVLAPGTETGFPLHSPYECKLGLSSPLRDWPVSKIMLPSPIEHVNGDWTLMFLYVSLIYSHSQIEIFYLNCNIVTSRSKRRTEVVWLTSSCSYAIKVTRFALFPTTC